MASSAVLRALSVLFFLLQIGVHLAYSRSTTLFQVLDASHLGLWINWWVIALETNSIPSDWELHLACFGSSSLDGIIRRYHAPGCSQLISSGIHFTRIYYAKAMALNKALRLGRDLLLVDVDALLVRNPSPWLQLESTYDIISSRDTGPSNLPHAREWGPHRFCTGFIFFRHSPHLLDFMEHVLQRVNRFGHDQVQFNNALSLSGLVWNSTRQVMNSDAQEDFNGTFVWPWPQWSQLQQQEQRGQQEQVLRMGFNPKDARWHRSNEDQIIVMEEDLRTMPFGKAVTGLDMPRRKMRVKLLKSATAMRYCNRVPSASDEVKSRYIVNAMPTADISDSLIALHCFFDEGHRGEQGVLKKEMKTMIMIAMHQWCLKPEFTFSGSSMNVRPNASTNLPATSLMLGRAHEANRLFLKRYREEAYLRDFLQVWILRNATYASTIVNPLRSLIKQGFFMSKMGVVSVDSASTSSRRSKTKGDVLFNRTRSARQKRSRLESA